MLKRFVEWVVGSTSAIEAVFTQEALKGGCVQLAIIKKLDQTRSATKFRGFGRHAFSTAPGVVLIISRGELGLDEQEFRAAGVAEWPADAQSFGALIKRASQACDRAELLSDGQEGAVAFFNSDLDRMWSLNREELVQISKAIIARDFEFHFQPILSVSHAEVVVLEMLARSKCFGAPDRFIGLVEQGGLSYDFDLMALRAAAEAAVSFDSMGILGKVRVGVNISPATLCEEDVFKAVVSIIEDAGARPDQLDIEIVETTRVVDYNKAALVLSRLRQYGLTFSIDDFGAGYASMTHLRSLKADTVKLDRSLVTGARHKLSNSQFLRETVAFAKGLNFSVVVEGIEDLGDWDCASHAGADYAQGYYISKPLSFADTASWLSQRSLSQSAFIREVSHVK